MAEAKYLVDSNICVYLLEAASVRLRERVSACEAGELVTSTVVYAEVGLGMDEHDSETLKVFARLFAEIEVKAFDTTAARAYWTLPFRRGRFDQLIAAHALSAGLTLITANVADFRGIAGLRVEDWTK